MNNLKNVLEMEEKIKFTIQQIKKEIINETNTTSIPNVKKINKNTAVINLSDLTNWSPNYYLANEQAKYIEKSFKNINTVTEFISKINEIIENKKIKIGNEICYINETTIDILKKYLKND